MKIRTLMIGAALTLAAGQAFAADAPPAAPMLVRGTIASINGTTIVITKNDGGTVTGTTVPMTFYAAVEPRRFDQIKATDFVGITSIPGPNDTLVAKEIHILPIHVGEGSYPWDHLPDGTKIAGSMTNGTVAVVHGAPTTAGSMTNGTVTMSDGWSLKVTYRGSDIGERQMRRPCACGGYRRLHRCRERVGNAVDSDRRDRAGQADGREDRPRRIRQCRNRRRRQAGRRLAGAGEERHQAADVIRGGILRLFGRRRVSITSGKIPIREGNKRCFVFPWP